MPPTPVPPTPVPPTPEMAAPPPRVPVARVVPAVATAAEQADTGPLPPYPPAQPDQEFYESLRATSEPPPVGPTRKLLGALLAVAAVLLGIGAFWLLNNDDTKGTPTVALPTHRASVTTAPTRAPSPTPRATTKPTSRPTPSATTAPTLAPVVAAPKFPVLVLNNSRIKGLADRSAARFRAGGWSVSGTGNYSGGTIAQTTVYYAPGQQSSAATFAKQFGIPRVLPRFSGLPGRGMTVVVTRDYR